MGKGHRGLCLCVMVMTLTHTSDGTRPRSKEWSYAYYNSFSGFKWTFISVSFHLLFPVPHRNPPTPLGVG